MKILRVLLIFIPISIVCGVIKINQTVIFILAALSIIPLAALMGKATEGIAAYTGPKIGGFLNATFGNATELIISFFAMKNGLFEVVKSSIAGSVIGNVLLVLGMSMFIGGIKHREQRFNKKVVEVSSSMLLFAVIGLTIPAIFTHTMNTKILNIKIEGFSIFIGVVMFLIYILSLIFSFYTHKHIYAVEAGECEKIEECDVWSKKKSILVLIVATVLIAIEAELLSSSIETVTKTLGLSEFFVGIIIIPIIGNAAENSTAVSMAIKNKMDVAIEIALGASLQIILFVAPILIFLSLLFTPMSIIFNAFELVALIVSVLIANRVASDGESNWLEGVQLLAVYAILAAAFFCI